MTTKRIVDMELVNRLGLFGATVCWQCKQQRSPESELEIGGYHVCERCFAEHKSLFKSSA